MVFDTPPQGLLQECAIYSADVLVTPAPVDYPGMDGAAQFVLLAQHIQKRERIAPPQLFVLPMFVDRRTSEARYNLEALQERFGDQVLEAVPVRTRMREAIAEGETIFDYAPGDDIAAIYMELCRTIAALRRDGAHGDAAHGNGARTEGKD